MAGEPAGWMQFTKLMVAESPAVSTSARVERTDAILSASIAVEVSEFADLIQKYRVNGVPKTVVDDTVEILGGIPEDAFVTEALRERIPAP